MLCMLAQIKRAIWIFIHLFVLIFVVIIGFLAILPFLIIVAIIVTMLAIPYYFGGRISFEAAIGEWLDRIIGNNKLQEVRNDLIIVFIPYLDRADHEELDRWSLLREMDRSHQEVKNRLKTGESVFAFFGGAISVIVIGFTGYMRLLSIFLLFLFLAVTIRVVATDVLAFSPVKNEHLPTAELAYLTRWNRGPVRQRGTMLMVFLTLFITLFAPPGSRRYNISMKVLSGSAAIQFGGDYKKWHAETE